MSSQHFFAAPLAILLIAGVTLATIQPLSAAAVPSRKHIHAEDRGASGPRNERTALPPRKAFTQDEQTLAQIPGMPDARFWEDSEQDFIRALPSTDGPWLALSAGGEGGAYGAGLLNGWSQSGNRPNFSVVTGVSAGALIAPFAFLGPAYDEVLHRQYATVTDADIFEAGATPESLLNTWPLKDLIAKEITAPLLAAIADEYRHGRRLFVVTTNLDAERSVVWNMGAIAAHGGNDALRLFREVLLASASIPGAFPPTYIDAQANGRTVHEMHVDGGLAAPFFVAPPRLLLAAKKDRLPITQLYVVINSKVTPEFTVTPRETLAILGRSIGALLKSGARNEFTQVNAAAQHQGFGASVAAIDPAFEYKAHGSFDPNNMKALYDLGAEEARAGTAFRNELPRPSSPEKSTAND